MPPRCRKPLDVLKKENIIVLLGLLRVLICLWPQTGYLHPDEFFQSADIVGGKFLNAKVEPVWEFETDRPIRCMLLPNLLNRIALKIVTILDSQPSAYLLIVGPRLAYTFASFSIDYCLLLLSQYYSAKGIPYLPISVIFQTSFICLGIFTRTLSNTIEAILLAWLLVVVCRIVRPSFRIVFITPKLSKPIDQRISRSAQITSSSLVGFLVTLGTFNRPTFPCFALVPCIYWLFESFKRNSHSIRLTTQRAALPLIISSFSTFLIISCYDTIYYSDQAIVRNMFDDLLNLEYEKFYLKVKTNWIITPYNFLIFNTDTEKLSKYGIHKPYTHLLVNMPLAFNLLAIIFYRKLIVHAVGTGLPRLLFNSHRIQATMILSTLAPIFLLSLIPHQEFRFLAPLVIPLVFICGPDIYKNKRLLGLWLAINFVLVYFYAKVHQSGVTTALLDMDSALKGLRDSKDDSLVVSVLATKCYPVPTYAWNIDQNDDRFYLNVGNTMVHNLYNNIDEKLQPTLERLYADVNSTSDHKLFIMLPRFYVDRLSEHLGAQLHFNAVVESVQNYSLHFGGEDFGESIEHIRKYGLQVWKEAFGFSLMQLKLQSGRGGDE